MLWYPWTKEWHIWLTWYCHLVWYIQYLWCEFEWIGRSRGTNEKHGRVWGGVSFGLGEIRQNWWQRQWRYKDGMFIVIWDEALELTRSASLPEEWYVWYIYRIWCVEPVKEQTERGCGKVWLRKFGRASRSCIKWLHAVSVRRECSYKRFYEVGDIVWELIGGSITCS